jgi:hypothetical protein
VNAKFPSRDNTISNVNLELGTILYLAPFESEHAASPARRAVLGVRFQNPDSIGELLFDIRKGAVVYESKRLS